MVTASAHACNPLDCSVVCRCLKVTAAEIREAAERVEMQTVRDVARHTGAGSGCMACHCTLKKLLAERRLANATPLPHPIATASSSAGQLVG